MNRKAYARALKTGVDALEALCDESESACATPSLRHPVLEHFDQLEAKLVAKGWPEVSPWWRGVIEKFYACTKQTLVLRVGRRGGKSTTCCRLAVLEALHGEHDIPPGDVGVVAIISVDRREASRRLRTIKQILDAIGVGYAPIDGGIQLNHKPIAFQVFTASIAGVSGFTSIFVFCDEVAKWKDSDTGANPATEVLASVRPTMATQASARMVMCSSPMGIQDAHADAFSRGDTDEQDVATAPTWVANPSLTEERTHALEPDELLWKREFAAIPLEDFESSVFTSALLDRAQRANDNAVPAAAGWSYVATMDPATRGNGWTLTVATRDLTQRRIVVLTHEWRGSPSKPLDPDDVYREAATMLAPYSVRHIRQDIHSFDENASIARRHNLTLVLHTLTQSQKVEMYDAVRTMLQDQPKDPEGKPLPARVELPADKRVRADLLGVRKRLTAAGYSIVLVEQNGRHSDFAPSVCLALTLHCAVPKPVPQGESDRVEADVMRRELEAHYRRTGKGKRGKGVPWWAKESA